MKPDGGPAFPQTMMIDQQGHLTSGWDGWGLGGDTLRDYFAAKAMQSLITMMARPAAEVAEQRIPLAEDAYLIADAMLRERGRE